MRRLDIGVAGCGPAGLAAALLLHRDGHRVTLFDRFDTPQPIGSGLMIQPTGMAVLDRLQLGDRICSQGARIDRLYGETGATGRAVLDVQYAALGGTRTFGVGIHRAALFAALHDAVVAHGVAIETRSTVTGSSAMSDGRRGLALAPGRVAGPFDLVVDALGTRSPLAPPCGRALAYGALWTTIDWPEAGGFDEAMLEQRYRRADRMAGLLPVGRLLGDAARKASFFWSLRADRLADWQGAGIAAWKNEVAALWPSASDLLVAITAPEQLTFARYAHRTLARPAEPAMIHIGDSWHSASPQLGQGANMALLDAYALATALRTEADLPAALDRTVALRRRHVRIYQLLTALFTPVYQSDGRLLPLARDHLVGPLSKMWPATWLQAAMVGGLIGNPLHPLGLAAR